MLTYSEEGEIAVTCTVLADMGFSLTKELVEVVVSDYLKENSISNPFTNGTPGMNC